MNLKFIKNKIGRWRKDKISNKLSLIVYIFLSSEIIDNWRWVVLWNCGQVNSRESQCACSWQMFVHKTVHGMILVDKAILISHCAHKHTTNTTKYKGIGTYNVFALLRLVIYQQTWKRGLSMWLTYVPPYIVYNKSVYKPICTYVWSTIHQVHESCCLGTFGRFQHANTLQPIQKAIVRTEYNYESKKIVKPSVTPPSCTYALGFQPKLFFFFSLFQHLQHQHQNHSILSTSHPLDILPPCCIFSSRRRRYLSIVWCLFIYIFIFYIIHTDVCTLYWRSTITSTSRSFTLYHLNEILRHPRDSKPSRRKLSFYRLPHFI